MQKFISFYHYLKDSNMYEAIDNGDGTRDKETTVTGTVPIDTKSSDGVKAGAGQVERETSEGEVYDYVDDEDTTAVVDKSAERRLCRKFDIRLMPMLSLLCKLYTVF